MDNYYNTTKETGEILVRANIMAGKQNDIVLDIFERYQRALSPSEVYAVFPKRVPITSIRRSITNLTKLGFLEKTDIMKVGIYGKREHYWKLAKQLKEGETLKLDL